MLLNALLVILLHLNAPVSSNSVNHFTTANRNTDNYITPGTSNSVNHFTPAYWNKDNYIAPASSNRVNYSIIEKSSLSLSGSSNVNRFECTTYDNFSNGFIIIHTEDEEETIKFNNAVLKINIKSFDCKNPLLTKDFYNTLNVKESPTIDVELLSAEPMGMSKILRSNKGKFKAEVAISLNGTSKLDNIIVHWEKTGLNTYRFIGEKELYMSDFDIESPVTALGLIRVNDEINISFDLFVQANPKIF